MSLKSNVLLGPVFVSLLFQCVSLTSRASNVYEYVFSQATNDPTWSGVIFLNTNSGQNLDQSIVLGWNIITPDGPCGSSLGDWGFAGLFSLTPTAINANQGVSFDIQQTTPSGWQMSATVGEIQTCYCGHGPTEIRHRTIGSWEGNGRADVVITTPPSDQTTIVGQTVTLTVGASGDDPKTYQWQYNGTGYPLSTNPTLTISSVQLTNAGQYQVVVSNVWGAVTSPPATLQIIAPPIISTLPGDLSYLNGQFTLTVTGLAGQGPAVIQTSTNLTTWSPVFTNPTATGSFRFTNSAAATPFQFYRASISPQ